MVWNTATCCAVPTSGEIFHVAVHGGVTHGATAELQKAHNLDVRQVPLALLIQDMEGLETRAASAAPADVQGNQQGILMYVFPQSAGYVAWYRYRPLFRQAKQYSQF